VSFIVVAIMTIDASNPNIRNIRSKNGENTPKQWRKMSLSFKLAVTAMTLSFVSLLVLPYDWLELRMLLFIISAILSIIAFFWRRIKNFIDNNNESNKKKIRRADEWRQILTIISFVVSVLAMIYSFCLWVYINN